MMALKRLVFVFGLLLLYFILGLSTARAEITVYDNDGQYLGILQGFSGWDDGVSIFIPSVGRFTGLSKLQDSARMDLNFYSPLYETMDCTGTAYTEIDPGIHPFVYRGCDDIYITAKGAKKTFTPKSTGCPQECYPAYPSEDTYYEIVPAPDLLFTLPVSLPLRYEHSTLGVEKVVIGPPK